MGACPVCQVDMQPSRFGHVCWQGLLPRTGFYVRCTRKSLVENQLELYRE
jgi:hypothetical protein